MSVVRVGAVPEFDVHSAFGGVFSGLSGHMSALDGFLRVQLGAFEPEIRPMVEYCLESSGKRIRPALVFLGGWRGSSVIASDLVRVAAVVEMVHLATLVHDDIMDAATVRRSRQTATRAYGPASAVLLGDALFAHALNVATQFPTSEVCAAVSESTRRVCSGEIVQTLRRGTTNVSLSDYRRIIDLKTAELFFVSCRLGAQLAGFAPEFVSAAGQFGRHLGIAYQIYDDLADYFGDETKIGKTLGTDLGSGKLTLPLIMLADRLPVRERETLELEVKGERLPFLPLRQQQMTELGVFEAVTLEIHRELDSASQTLELSTLESPTPLLLSLCDVLRGQVSGLRGQ
ncbi:MAG: polyprenyl synthetase family protein [Opitutus sp.]